MAFGRPLVSPCWPRLVPVALVAILVGSQGRVFAAAGGGAFVAKYCGDCHGADEQEGDVRLDTLPAAPAKPDELAAWKQVYEKITNQSNQQNFSPANRLRSEKPFIAPGPEHCSCKGYDHKNKEGRIVYSSESLSQIFGFY